MPAENQKNANRPTRLIGGYLFYIAGLMVFVGMALGIFIYLMDSMGRIGTGLADTNEYPYFFRRPLVIPGLIVTCGLLTGGAGWFHIRQRNRG